jgi:thiol-disulfide isomerase/thioredoxin
VARLQLTGGMATLVYVRAEGCTVCIEKAPVAGAIARELGIPLEVVDLDDDEGRQRAAALRIRKIPTLALVAGARVPFRLVGRMITTENVMRMYRATRQEAHDSTAGS